MYNPVLNRDIIRNVDLNPNHFFTNLPTTIKSKFNQGDSNPYLETLYELVKHVNEDDYIKDFLIFGIIRKDLTDSLNELFNKLIGHHSTDENIDYYSLLKEEYNKLPKELLIPSLVTKFRIESIFTYMNNELNNNPIYSELYDCLGYLSRINNFS